MNGHEFIETLNCTAAISEQLLNELKYTVGKYPYFGMARLAYLRQLCINANSDFGKELPHAAVYAKSSEWLYEFIYRKEATIAENLQKEGAAVQTQDSNAEAEGKQKVAETHEKLQTEKVEAKAKNAETLQPVEEKPHATDKQDDIFELISDDEKAVSNDLNEVLDQKFYTLSEPETHPENPSDLIEQFLTINPRIVPKPDLPQENEDISLSSLEDDGEIVTEMLAKIYVSQGLISKAINAYTKLSLKYPEKRAYFVAEIEKLEK